MRLLVIEPTRKKPKIGDVFVIQPVSGKFLYGHVVKTNLENRDPLIKGWSLIFMFRHMNDKLVLPESFDDLEFLIPPLIVNNQGWLKGYYKTIGNVPVSMEEMEKNYGFWDVLHKKFVNVEGESIGFTPKIYGDYGLGSYGALSYEVEKLLKREPDLFRDLTQEVHDVEQSLVNFLKDYVEIVKEKYNESLSVSDEEFVDDKNFRLGSNFAYYDCLDVLEQQLINFGFELSQFDKVSPDFGNRVEQHGVVKLEEGVMLHNWERIYNNAFQDRDDVIQWDMQPVRDGQVIKIRFISTNSNKKQGARVALDKGIEIDGRLHPSIQLWEDSIPEDVVCKCHTNNGLLSIYNMWDKGRGPDSQSFSSEMLVVRRGDLSM